MKGFARQQGRAWIETSIRSGTLEERDRFARQQGRAWIETCLSRMAVLRIRRVRPSAMTGVDGNLQNMLWLEPPSRFARQQGRAWIETSTCCAMPWSSTVRPSAMTGVDGNGSCPHLLRRKAPGSPVSNDGRGLKPVKQYTFALRVQVRPSAMTGVDGNHCCAAKVMPPCPVRPSAMTGVDGNLGPWAIGAQRLWFARQQGRAWIETIGRRNPRKGHGEVRPSAMTGVDGNLVFKQWRGSCNRFARQQGRAWIETASRTRELPTRWWFARQQGRAWIETVVHVDDHGGLGVRPSAMTGVDGNKQLTGMLVAAMAVRPSAMTGVDGNIPKGAKRLTLEQVRPSAMTGVDGNKAYTAAYVIRYGAVRPSAMTGVDGNNSPVSSRATCAWFARQQGRAWIETMYIVRNMALTGGSPVSNDGRGLKQAGRGLDGGSSLVRPSAMTGVDGN